MEYGVIVDYKIDDTRTGTYRFYNIKNFLAECNHLKDGDYEVINFIIDGEKLTEYKTSCGTDKINTMHDVKCYCRRICPRDTIKKEIPRHIQEQLALSGSGFQDGMKRIYKFFQTKSNNSDRAKFLKKEYGIGGAGLCEYRPNRLSGYDTYSKGGDLKIEWIDEDCNKCYNTMSYNALAIIIGELIKEGKYYRQKVEPITKVDTVAKVIARTFTSVKQLQGQLTIDDWIGTT